jgi:hypothetical protein
MRKPRSVSKNSCGDDFGIGWKNSLFLRQTFMRFAEWALRCAWVGDLTSQRTARRLP